MAVKIKNIPCQHDWRKLTPHPFSELTEFGVGIDTDALTDHMARNGWDKSERITIYCGKILDGRHKHSSAQQAEVEPLFQEFQGDDAEAIQFVTKKLLRQHLDTSQRAMVAAKLANLKAGMNQHSEEVAQECATSINEAAQTMSVGERSVTNAKIVQDKCTPAVQRAVRTGDVTVTDAASVANETKGNQDKALQAIRDKKAKTLREALGPPKTKKPKKPPKPEHQSLPKSVQNALADTWHLDSARILASMRKQARGVISWSVWLDLDSLNRHLDLAEQCFLAAAPRRACDECKGMKAIGKEACTVCRGGGFMGSQA